MPHNSRSPEDFESIKYLWVMAIAIWGGITHNIQAYRNRKDKTKKWSPTGLISDILMSGFIGLMTFYVAESASVPETMTAVLVGVMSHMGTKAMNVLENAVSSRIAAIVGGAGNDSKGS